MVDQHRSWSWLARLAVLGLFAFPWQAAVAHDWTVRVDGVGPLRVGMPVDLVQRLLDEPLQVDDVSPSSCRQLAPPDQPGMLLMLVDGVFKRVDVSVPGIASERGIAVGDPVAKVVRLYGEAARSAASPDDVHIQYWTVRAGDGLYGLRFVVNAGHVSAYYAGAWEQVQYGAGCPPRSRP